MTEHKCGCKGVLDFFTVTNETGDLISFSKTSLYALSIVHDDDGVWELNVHLASGDTEVLVEAGTEEEVKAHYHRICDKLGIRTTNLTEY